MMAGYAKMKGTPAPELAVGTSGILLLLGGLSLLLGFHPTIGVILLAIFLLPAAFMIHNFWAVQDPQAKMNDLVNFEKNIAILGFASDDATRHATLAHEPRPLSLTPIAMLLGRAARACAGHLSSVGVQARSLSLRRRRFWN